MLRLLHIENIAIIERADIEFGMGLTVLTGETGAGKSIVIDAITALLGQRTSRELIRTGESKGFVSAVFTNLTPVLRDALDTLDLAGEEAETLYVQRQITADGKSTCRVNMRPATVSVLKSLAPYLINIHGQHDGQKLMDEQYHIEFLDSFADSSALLEEYTPQYQHLFALKRQITELDKNEQARLQKIDMLRFHADEIDTIAPAIGEDEQLDEKKSIFDNAGHLMNALQIATTALRGADDEGGGACALLTEVSLALDNIHDVSDAIRMLFTQAEELRYLALDLADSVVAQRAGIDFSPAQAAVVEERLDALYRLKQKYGETLKDVLVYREKIGIELDTLSTANETRDGLREEYKFELARAKLTARRLSNLRRQQAAELEKRIVSELADLDMDKARFSVKVETGTKLTSHGMDTVAFLISVNPGETLKPLSKVASGGELSRVMLAMKNILTAGEPVETLVFDEIDTGVSGRAAQKIARKLASIGEKKQTLCVTHLPQIAAMGDNHLLIIKSVRDERSYTEFVPLKDGCRTDEIARMISGDEITDITRSNACELLGAAAKTKKEESTNDAAI